MVGSDLLSDGVFGSGSGWSGVERGSKGGFFVELEVLGADDGVGVTEWRGGEGVGLMEGRGTWGCMV